MTEKAIKDQNLLPKVKRKKTKKKIHLVQQLLILSGAERRRIPLDRVPRGTSPFLPSPRLITSCWMTAAITNPERVTERESGGEGEEEIKGTRK